MAFQNVAQTPSKTGLSRQRCFLVFLRLGVGLGVLWG